MSSLLTQVLIYMLCTFALGTALGWLLWRFGGSKEVASMESEISFWKQNLEQSRLEREQDLNKIAVLTQEKENLRKRLAAMKPQTGS